MTCDFKSFCTRKRIPMSLFPLLNESSVAFSSPLDDILPLIVSILLLSFGISFGLGRL